ncbi:MAG: NADH-ubiquinone oxidoreductase-F iron-sulfur binding region domain-containing protein [Candidatus Omnitrophota bacterium]
MGINKIVTEYFDRVDPKEIKTYIACGGLEAVKKAVEEIGPEGVIEIIKESSLLGRGGAGFSVGKKWEFTSNAKSNEKYLICNADEGEVGTFKDRYILEHNPFLVIEGIAIASYAIGAKKAFIYLRQEYAYMLDMIDKAIRQLKERIDKLIDLEIKIYSGAGAYVCGEETALIESIEGRRGEARFRPPYPPAEGLWGKPTSVNNVETLANIPKIILNGADWFNKIGTEKSKGTKLFSVSGDVAKPGVYELVMGSELRELLELAGANDTKMVLVGGAAGKIITEKELDIAVSYETVLGAGAVIVFNKSRGAVEIAFKTMEFFYDECCGKCAPCREGTMVMLEILERLNNKKAAKADIKNIEALSNTMNITSLCGLGQTAPNVVVDTLKNYKDEYLAGLLKEF